MNNFYIHCFIKFGDKNSIYDLFENGTIYCNPVEYFKKLEDKFRGDIYEGASFIRNYPPGQFKMSIAGKQIDKEFNFLKLHIKESYEKTLGNIYSLFCLSSKILKGDKPIYLDKRLKDFGQYAILIKDNPRFLELIKNALKKKKIVYKLGLVEYYDKNIYTGSVDVFNKPLEYSYQNEYRIYLRRRSDEPFIFRIGSLKNIAEIYSANDFIDTFEATEKK